MTGNFKLWGDAAFRATPLPPGSTHAFLKLKARNQEVTRAVNPIPIDASSGISCPATFLCQIAVYTAEPIPKSAAPTKG